LALDFVLVVHMLKPIKKRIEELEAGTDDLWCMLYRERALPVYQRWSRIFTMSDVPIYPESDRYIPCMGKRAIT
jgi:hypothetical protein